MHAMYLEQKLEEHVAVQETRPFPPFLVFDDNVSEEAP